VNQLKRVGIYGGGFHFVILSITQPFFALYAAELGVSTALIGIMLTLRAVLPLVIAMPIGQLIDRIGAPQLLRLGNLITVISLCLMVWSPNLWVLALSQLLIGAGTMIVASSLQVVVSEGDKAERERNIIRYSTWSSGGSMIGPLVGGGIITAVSSMSVLGWSGTAVIGYRAAFLLALVSSVIFGIIIRYASRNIEKKSWFGPEVREVIQPKEIADSYLQGIHLIKHPGVQFGLMATFLIHFIQTIWTGFFPLYLDSLGYSAVIISVLVSIRGLAGLTSRSFLGQLTKRWAHKRILIIAGCIATICLICLPLFGWNMLLIGLISFVLGSAVGVNMPISTIIMVDDDLEGERGKVMGLRLLVNRSSQIAAPILFGVIGQLLGLSVAFISGGAGMLVSLLGFSLYNRSRSVKMEKNKVNALLKGDSVPGNTGV
jgi:MFS family permease